MPKLLGPKKTANSDHKSTSLNDVRSGDFLEGKDGTRYQVLSVSEAYKTGRRVREKSLTLLNLSTNRGIVDSVSGWKKNGITLPARPE